MASLGKYRSSFRERFGFHVPQILKTSQQLIWLHAVSVGETKTLAPLAKKIHDFNPNAQLIITSGTETGHVIAKQTIPFANEYHYLPPDFGWAMKRMMKAAKPDILILCETDYWYNFLRFAKQYGALLVLVNGKISSKSTQRFTRFRFYARKVFDLIDLFCLQNEIYKKRFLRLGVPEDRIQVTGNLKFDMYYPKFSYKEMAFWKQKIGVDNQPLLVIGSSHYPEEEMILSQLETVWKQFPELKVIIVPRHPERFNEVANLLERKKIRFSRYSQGLASSHAQVILIDTMGLLRQCYQFADIAIVAGSYTEHVGGHNILEPCGYGVPVIFGPYMFSQPELVSLALEYEAGIQVSQEQISETVICLLSNHSLRSMMGKNGLKLIQDNKGAVERTWQFILSAFRERNSES